MITIKKNSEMMAKNDGNDEESIGLLSYHCSEWILFLFLLLQRIESLDSLRFKCNL